jgi:IclR family KDG regulon transcriptional repressor
MDIEKASSLRRAIELLLALADDEALSSDGLGVQRLAELLAQDKSRVSRTLRTLNEYALVERDAETLAYRLGWQLYVLASRAGNARLLNAAPGHVAQLVSDLCESAHLSVLSGHDVLTVISVTSPRAVAAQSLVGSLFPAHCTSAGRALLMDSSKDDLHRLFRGEALPAGGPNAPRSVEELHARISAARELGHATVIEETEPGLVAVAAPVRDHRGRIVAALNVSGPAFRFTPALSRAGTRVADQARALSREIGWGAHQEPMTMGSPQRPERGTRNVQDPSDAALRC